SGGFTGAPWVRSGRPPVTTTVVGERSSERCEVTAAGYPARCSGRGRRQVGSGAMDATAQPHDQIPAQTDGPGRRPRVMVGFGGRSGEHGISCATAGGVLRAIDRDRYDVLAVGITPAGRWVLADDD